MGGFVPVNFAHFHDIVHLDSTIRDFVLIPILVVTFLVNMLRVTVSSNSQSNMELATGMMAPPAPAMGQQMDNKTLNLLGRAKLLKMNGHYLSPKAFRVRKAFFNKPSVGAFHQPVENKMAQTPDMSQMMGSLSSMVFYLHQVVLYYWISILFSGFLVAKAPFPLTFRFKKILQLDVNVPALDVTYISSLSWYMFNLCGFSGLLQIVQNLVEKTHIFEETTLPKPSITQMVAADQQANALSSMVQNMMTGGTNLGPNLKQERESLDEVYHEDILEDIEKKLCDRWLHEHTNELKV